MFLFATIVTLNTVTTTPRCAFGRVLLIPMNMLTIRVGVTASGPVLLVVMPGQATGHASLVVRRGTYMLTTAPTVAYLIAILFLTTTPTLKFGNVYTIVQEGGSLITVPRHVFQPVLASGPSSVSVITLLASLYVLKASSQISTITESATLPATTTGLLIALHLVVCRIART